tara:strand:- start:146 stop:1300 length:1155 start_codon:yes stop_codon:yes gene_type:complete
MKSKSPFAMKSPLLAYKSDMKGNYANPEYVPETIVGAEVGANIAKTAASVFDSYANSKKSTQKVNELTPETFEDLKPFKTPEIAVGGGLTSRKTIHSTPSTSSTSYNEALNTLKENPKKLSNWEKKFGKATPDNFKKETDLYNKKNNSTTDQNEITEVFGDGRLLKTYSNPIGQMKGSPNKLIGDTMNINPGAVPPNQAQNDLGAQPIISADGSQPNARAIDIAAIANPYATPGADFNPQSKMKAESIFGSPMQRQGLMNLGTPLHDAGHGAKQSHSHPSKTTTKMKPDGEYPGAKYVKGDLVDQDDLLDKTKLDAHIATQVQSDKKGTFIKEKSDDGPGSDIETSKGFGKKIRLGSMGRSSYTSNMKDQLDPNDFLFKNTPKK